MMTDMDGNFHLEVTDKKVTLMVSYIGYASQEVVATPGKPMSIILKVDNNLLDEVIVTDMVLSRNRLMQVLLVS